MTSKYKEVDNYVAGLEGDAKEWTMVFVQYMRENYPELEEVISFKMPTYKLGSGKERNYIAFGFGKAHFSLHSMDFAYISELKEKLSKAGKGKGCVNVPFNKPLEREILFKAIDEIVERSRGKIIVEDSK
nr:DUF1801 domain-containing protein [uncultured Niameybacter sp.]